MTIKQREEIRMLAMDAQDKRVLYQGCQMLNAYGRTPDELRTMHAEYAVAEAEFFEANSRMRRAIDAFNTYV